MVSIVDRARKTKGKGPKRWRMDSSTNRVRRARREAVLEGEGENRKRRIRSQSRRGMGRIRKFLSFRAGFRILLAVIASREWTQVWRKLKKDTILEHDAAQYRDELKAISPHSLLKCSSDITTVGTRVQVRSVYIEGRNQPSKGQYFFAYRIRITNNSDRPVQLLWRHWIITDGNGKSENFWGIGVIGEQPVLLPKTGFEYSSACPLSTPSGRMGGFHENLQKREQL